MKLKSGVAMVIFSHYTCIIYSKNTKTHSISIYYVINSMFSSIPLIHIDLHSCVSFSLCVHNFLQFASSALFSHHFNFFCISFSANLKLNILFSSSSPLRNTISFYYCYRFHFTDLEDSFFISILLCVCVPILLYAVCISLLLLVSFLVFICSVCAGHDQ